MKESRQLEFKENITNTFLKTVSAYANYSGGEIVFGVSDNGDIKGIDNPVSACLDIENRINDSINPVPDYRLEVDEAKSVIRLIVQEGAEVLNILHK